MHKISDDPEWNVCLNLLLDPDVSEIVSNGPDEFFVTKNGKRMRLDIRLSGAEKYDDSIRYGLLPHIKSDIPYDNKSYLYEGPLEYFGGETKVKARCHIVLPPSAYHPQVTIAKKSTSLVDLDSIAARGSMSSEMLDFLKACVQGHLTTVFSGGTGAGKTTMLESLTKLIPDSYRIGVAEDIPELVLTQSNVTYLHSVPWRPGMDPNNVASLAWVVQQFQRMRINKVIIGETRGREFADFLIAANSGMSGSMTTLHAEDPKGCLRKMTEFGLMGSTGQPVRSVNTSIAHAVDIVVQLGLLPDGRHKVFAIEEITTTIGQGEDAQITTQTLYRYDSVNDCFVKDMQVTDYLRAKMIRAGINIERFLSTPPGTRSPGHGGPTESATAAMNQAAESNNNNNNNGRNSPFRRSIPTGPIGGRRSL